MYGVILIIELYKIIILEFKRKNNISYLILIVLEYYKVLCFIKDNILKENINFKRLEN